MKRERLYPDSKVEVRGIGARHYDFFVNLLSFGIYRIFIQNVIKKMDIQAGHRVLDFGAGSGRNACIMRRYFGESGELLGLDIGEEMSKSFHRNCDKFTNVSLENRRIDVEYTPKKPFDKVFISFVLHGLPQKSRIEVLKNAYRALKPKGMFHILDYGEYDPGKKPLYVRWYFRYAECPYAADYVKRDWRKLLGEAGFGNFRKKTYFLGLVRLLTAEKADS